MASIFTLVHGQAFGKEVVPLVETTGAVSSLELHDSVSLPGLGCDASLAADNIGPYNVAHSDEL